MAAVLVFMVLFTGSGTSIASVQRSIDRAHTIQFQSTLVLERDGHVIELSTAQSWADRELGARLDVQALGMPLAQFWLPYQGQPILVDHTHRAVMPMALPDTLNPRELLRLDPASLVRQIGRFAGDIQPIAVDESTSPTLVPGNNHGDTDNLRGFRLSAASMGLSDDSMLELWVDITTLRLTRVYARVPSGKNEMVVWTLDQFKWDEPFDVGKLMLDIPTDYERIDPLVIPMPGEQPLTRTLARLAKLDNGRFPTTQMLAWESLVKILTVSLRSSSSWSSLPEPLNSERGQREALGDVIAGGLFCLQLHDAGAKPEYFGKEVHFGDQQPLLRWQQRDGRTRQINGKLEWQTLP